MKSILSVHYTNHLLKELQSDAVAHVQMRGQHQSISLSARRCGKHEWHPRRRFVPTGGLVVSVRLAAQSGYSRLSIQSRRLRPGWTDEQVQRAVARMLSVALVERQRVEAVLALDRWIEAQKGQIEGFEDKVEIEEKASGRTAAYDEMTIEQADEWRRWITTLLPATVV